MMKPRQSENMKESNRERPAEVIYNGPKFLAHWFTPREPQDDE